MAFAVTYTFVNGNLADADEVNQNFTDVENFVNATHTSYNSCPIGTVVAWLKSYTNTPSLPAGWVECNGQTLSDSDSPYNGQTIPDLNNNNYFLRGNTTSSGTGGASTHTHSFTESSSYTGLYVHSNTSDYIRYGSLGANYIVVHRTASSSSIPPYYDVVWIMRVK